MEDAEAAVDDPELPECVEVGDDAGDDPRDVQDVQHGDGDQGRGQQAAEVPGLPVLDHDHEEEDVEDEGEAGDDRPRDPPPGLAGDDLGSYGL